MMFALGFWLMCRKNKRKKKKKERKQKRRVLMIGRYNSTVGPCYSRTFLSANLLIHILKLVQNDKFKSKMDFFICEFKICGPKWQKVSTANNKGNLYLMIFLCQRFLTIKMCFNTGTWKNVLVFFFWLFFCILLKENLF